MLKTRIIPCLDVRDGRVVKGVRFGDIRDAGDPVEASARYEAEGADEIVILDISATPRELAHGYEVVGAVRERLRLPLTVGGGVRTVEDARRLLESGADKVAVNTAAVREPELLEALAAEFGRQCVVLAVDARRCGTSWEVVVRSGADRTGRDAVEWAAEGERRGAGEVLLTSWDQDGTKAGYDIPLLESVCGRLRCPVIASGGAAEVDHFVDGARAGATALLAASIFHFQEVAIADLKSALADRGVPMRRGLQR
ncbi:MAG: imidazole glycerol phosphate synthase subunit HisF [Myxococcota bacterium]